MFKRIFACTLAVLLIGMYVLTLILGLMQDPKTTDLLMASIGATILVPIMLYAYQRIYALIHPQVRDGSDKEQ